MACTSASTAYRFIMEIKEHIKRERVDLSQVNELEIQCKHSCQMDFITKQLDVLKVTWISVPMSTALQLDIGSFLDHSRDNHLKESSLTIILTAQLIKKIVKKSFSEREIDKHAKKFYRNELIASQKNNFELKQNNFELKQNNYEMRNKLEKIQKILTS